MKKGRVSDRGGDAKRARCWVFHESYLRIFQLCLSVCVCFGLPDAALGSVGDHVLDVPLGVETPVEACAGRCLESKGSGYTSERQCLCLKREGVNMLRPPSTWAGVSTGKQSGCEQVSGR